MRHLIIRGLQWLHGPDDLATGGSPSTPPSSSPPSQAPSGPIPGAGPSSPGISPPESTGGGAPSGAPVAGPGQAPAASDYLGIRDALRQYAPDLAQQFGDDQAALQHLIMAHRQAAQNNEMAALGQQVLPHWSKFQEWAKQQLAAQQKPAQQGWWDGKPKFDPGLQAQVRYNAETGKWENVGNAAPDAAQKWVEWQQHQRGFLNDLASNPIEALKGGLEPMIRAEAERIVQGYVGQIQQHESMQRIENEVADWAYAKDPTGNLVRDHQGNAVLSSYGQVFTRGIREATQLGITDPNAKATYAQRMLALHVYGSQQAPQNPAAAAATNESIKQDFLNAAAGSRPNGNQSPSAPAPNNAAVPQPSAGSGAGALQAMLKAKFRANGHSDLSAPLDMSSR